MKWKKLFKRMIPLLCITFMVSCGAEGAPLEPVAPVENTAETPAAEDAPGMDIPEVEVGDEISDVLADVAADVAVNSGEEPMEIVWGYNNIPGQDFTNVLMPDDSAVIKQLNEQFNVTLKGVMIPFENNMYYGNWESASLAALPDVLVVSGDADYAYGTGNFRTIPHDMVQQYAPNLAALLDSTESGWAANNATGSANEFLGLGSYYESAPQLGLYSAYRLDWLEQAGFELPADMVEISPGQYFTPTPFTIEDFTAAMLAFAQAASVTPEHYGFTFPLSNDIQSVMSSDIPLLANMFGLNTDSMNDGGKVNKYYATPAYREFLAFLADMYKQGHAAVKGTSEVEYNMNSTSGSGGDGGRNQLYEVGYWNEFTSMLVDDGAWYSTGRQLLDANTAAKILYAPPETYLPFTAPAQTAATGTFYAGRVDLIMVNKNVSDEKLAVILDIYDTCAFDPETKVLATYGIEGVNFDWAGEPFNSFVSEKPTEESPSYNNSANLLNPPIMGGPAYSPFYENNIDPNNPVYQHSITPEAVAMMMPAYKADFLGEFNEELTAWNNAHYAGMRTVITDYFYEVVMGEADLEATWDAYIADVNAAGLPELLEIMEQYSML